MGITTVILQRDVNQTWELAFGKFETGWRNFCANRLPPDLQRVGDVDDAIQEMWVKCRESLEDGELRCSKDLCERAYRELRDICRNYTRQGIRTKNLQQVEASRSKLTSAHEVEAKDLLSHQLKRLGELEQKIDLALRTYDHQEKGILDLYLAAHSFAGTAKALKQSSWMVRSITFEFKERPEFDLRTLRDDFPREIATLRSHRRDMLFCRSLTLILDRRTDVEGGSERP